MIGQAKANLRAVVPGVVLVLAFVACTHVPTDRRAFQRAERSGSAMAYEQFAASFPASPLAADARKRAAQQRDEETLRVFEGVKDATKASILERFIVRHPGTKAATLAKLRVAEIDFYDLDTDNPFRPWRSSNSSWEGFLAFYAFGEYIAIPEDAELRDTYYKTLHPLVLQALAKVGSFEAWGGYLTTYPDGPLFDQAAQQAEDFLVARSEKWEGYEMLKTYLALYDEKIKRPCPRRDALVRKFHDGLAGAVEEQDTLRQYERYLDTFPDSPHNERITLRKAHLEFRDALLGSDRAKLEGLIAKYPGAKDDIAAARSRIEVLDYESAVREGTPQAFYRFRDRYEKSDPANLLGEIARKLETLRRQMLAKVRADNRARSYRAFLADFPDAPERGEVLRLLEEAEFSEAIKGSDRARIEEVLRRYPGSAFSERALARVDQIDFEKARTEALNEPSTVPLRRYLDAHSKGKYVTVAQALIEEIDQHYTAYMDRLERARGAGDLAIFSKWLTDNPGNHYAARRGRDDLDALRREVAIEDLVEDLTTTQTERARRTVPAARARALNKYARAIAYVESNTGGSTGFLFRGGGLLVTNARMLHNADLTRVSAKLGGRSYVCRVVSVADRQGPDVAVLRIEETFDPIPLGNSAVLDGGEKVTCLSARDSKTVHSEGTFIETRTAGGNEWLIISSTKIPVDLGGVVLNSRAEAVGLLVRSEQVDPAVKEDAPDRVYALSLRSALPHMKKALSE